jgi:sec-independent protein translocase protein TatC
MARAEAVQLTALEHVHELARRLMGSVAILFSGAIAAYMLRLQIINYLQRPLHQTLYYTSPMGSFQFVMQVCLLCGALLALPVLLYNLLRFIEPAFTKTFSRKMVLGILSASLFLTFAGAGFAYYVTLPVALRFFSTVGTSDLHPLISVNEYFSFILGYLATFALVFQLPLALLFMDHIRPIGPSPLRKKRPLVYVGAFAISLIMPSSPDPLSQVSLAIPIIALYELSILLIWRQDRRRRRAAAKVAAVNMSVQPQPVAAQQPTHKVAAEPIMATTASLRRDRSIDGIAATGRRRTTLPRTNYQNAVTRSGPGQTRAGRSAPRLISDIL